jgi:hypothetical protein
MQTYVRMMQVVLMAGLAASQSITTTMTSNTTTMPSTTTNGTGVRTTTAAIQITQAVELKPNKTACGFVWGVDYYEKDETDSMCDFYLVMSYGFSIGAGVWLLCALIYIVLLITKQPKCLGQKVSSSYWCMFVALVELALILSFWPLAILVPLVYYGYRASFGTANCDCFDSQPEQASAGGGNAGASSSVSNPAQTVPPLVTGPATAGAGAQFNQRFPKIAPGDCRPKYSRVQTSAC